MTELWRTDLMGSAELCLACYYIVAGNNGYESKLEENGEEIRKRTEQDDEKNP